jgi:two-component system, cell cycle response regulator DivK
MSKCILVVEDQEDNRRILRDLLGNAGYALIEAESGEEALTAVDVRLPVMDGYEAARRIKSNPDTKAVPIIAVTSRARGLTRAFGGVIRPARPARLSPASDQACRSLL